MKKLNTIFLLITFLLILLAGDILQAQNCSLSLDTTQNYIVGSAFNIKPGDVVCFEAGNKDYIQLKDIHGTADQPITFINKGGAVVINTDHYFGIKIGNCSHIIFRGNGTTNLKYGFQVTRVAAGAGLSVDDKSSDVEISNMEISHTFIGGVYAKTDPSCGDYSATRDKFTMYNFSFHDCYVHDVPDEGLYIGNSHFTGFHLTNGCDTVVYPQVLKGVHIYNNLIEHTGYDGIQVSSADSNCSIHDNTINFDSQAGILTQMSGIMIGGGSKCDTYNNKILNGKGDGIDVFGLGNFKIFNNLIVNAGQNYLPNQPAIQKHGIYIGIDSTSANAQLGIYNNTIISPKSFGITLTNTELSKTRIINNLITDPGKYATDGEQAFINTNISSTRIEKSNNYLSDSNDRLKFVSMNSGNYDLQPDSPAVNYGTDLSAEGVTFDILGRTRPFHTYFDAGAFECHDPTADVAYLKAPDVSLLKIYPNPTHNELNISYQLKNPQHVQLWVVDLNGRELMHKKLESTNAQTKTYHIVLPVMANGVYFIKIKTKMGISGKPFIINQ